MRVVVVDTAAGTLFSVHSTERSFLARGVMPDFCQLEHPELPHTMLKSQNALIDDCLMIRIASCLLLTLAVGFATPVIEKI